jgi:hypothetical protein
MAVLGRFGFGSIPTFFCATAMTRRSSSMKFSISSSCIWSGNSRSIVFEAEHVIEAFLTQEQALEELKARGEDLGVYTKV